MPSPRSWKQGVFICLLSLGCLSGQVAAQADGLETRDELWPEIDLYLSLSAKWRLFFLANMSRERETDDDLEGQTGLHIDYFFNKYLVFRTGYRYGFSLEEDDPFQEHRILFEQTIRVPI